MGRHSVRKKRESMTKTTALEKGLWDWCHLRTARLTKLVSTKAPTAAAPPAMAIPM